MCAHTGRLESLPYILLATFFPQCYAPRGRFGTETSRTSQPGRHEVARASSPWIMGRDAHATSSACYVPAPISLCSRRKSLSPRSTIRSTPATSIIVPLDNSDS